MYLNVSEHDFINNSNKYNQHKDNFSYDGKKALYKYLVDIEEDTGEQIQLDWIAICCDYTEYDNEKELLEAYNVKSLDDIIEQTQLIQFKYYDKPEDYHSDNWIYRYIVFNY